MTKTLTYTGQLVATTCWCGVRHAVPKELYDMVERQHQDGLNQTSIYCPLGHEWTFAGEAEVERLSRELQGVRQSARATRDLLEAEERSHSATRGHLTRTKKRVGNGVCPCCNRHFVNVERHMKSKHPDYKDSP